MLQRTKFAASRTLTQLAVLAGIAWCAPADKTVHPILAHRTIQTLLHVRQTIIDVFLADDSSVTTETETTEALNITHDALSTILARTRVAGADPLLTAVPTVPILAITTKALQ